MGNDTRQRIVLAAMQLFWAKGYGSTSISDVLRAADVNSGSLYHFFPGKQDLLLAVLDLYEHGLHDMLLQPAWAGVDDPVERVFALLARYRHNIVSTDCTYGCPIGSVALEIHEPDPPVRLALARNFEGWTTAIKACLDAAGDRLPSSLDRQALAEFVLTSMEGGVMQARTHRDVAFFDRTVRQLRDYIDLLQRAATAPGPAGAQTAGRRAAGRRKTLSQPKERS
jgi:AcrR family transcriptional regulator